MIDLDILSDFQTEARGLLQELTPIVDQLEESGKGEFPSALLAQFAQRIDRIMGAADTLNQLAKSHMGLKRIGAIARVCKYMGYKASEYKATKLMPLFAAFWADTLDVLNDLIDEVADESKSNELAAQFAQVLEKRLNWLNEKLKEFAPVSDEAKNQAEVDDLLAGLLK